MRVLMHVCCGPCAVYPLEVLREEGLEVQGYFHNPNIHPYREFRRRIGGVRELAKARDFAVEIDTEYGLTTYLRRVVHREKQRCVLCYRMRLETVARKAAREGWDAFTTTLLYSRYQKHRELRNQGEEMAHRFGVPFLYRDFREGWQRGIDQSIALELYRQPYCGCIYSEQERYDKKLRKKMRRAAERSG